jgi:hypothetical protein
MRSSRGRAAGVVAVVAALASGCALVVDGLDTDFSVPDDGAAPAADAARQDATVTATDAADDSSAPQLPAPTLFAAFPLCSEATTNAWHLDCGFGVNGSVVVDVRAAGMAAPVLTEGAGSAAVYVAVARDTGTFIEGIDGDGGRTVFAIPADAGIPIDLTTTSLKVTEVITMLSNRPVGDTSGTMTLVISSKVLQGPPVDSTNDIGVAVVATDASLVAVRPLVVTPFGTGGAVGMAYFVNYLDGGFPFAPGKGTAEATSSGVATAAINELHASGPDADAIDLGPIATGIDILNTFTFVVGSPRDGASTSYQISDDAAAAAPAAVLPLPYVVDDSVAVAEVDSHGGQFTYPLVAGRVDGGARVDSLDPFMDASSSPTFPFADPGVGPLRLRAVHRDGGDGLLVAGANSSTGNLYLALYSISTSPFALSADPAFGDAGFLVVPLKFSAQLGAAVSSQGAYYVSLTLTDGDAGVNAGAAVVIRIAPPGSP